jgi:hypothetical protein
MDLKAKLNAAVNRANMGPGDGQKKKSSYGSSYAGGARNISTPKMEVKKTTVKVTNPNAPTALAGVKPKMTAPAAPTTPKEARQAGRIQRIQVRNENKLDKIKSPKTAEEKQARNKRVAGAVGTAASAVVSGLELVDRTRQTFPGKKTGN